MGEPGIDPSAVEAARKIASYSLREPAEEVVNGNDEVIRTIQTIREDPAQFRPSEIIAGVHTLSVHYHSDNSWRVRGYPEEAKGHHDWEAGLLEVRLTGCSEQLLRETLLHEIVHMIFAMSGLNKHWPGATSEDPEEVVVEFASTALLQVLQANPMLVSYLMDSSV